MSAVVSLGFLLGGASALLALFAALGIGLGGGLGGLKRALMVSLATFFSAMAVLALGGSNFYASLIVSPFIAAGFIRYVNEAGRPELARRLAVALIAILGASGLFVVGGAVLLYLAISSWSSSTSSGGSADFK